jgi:hypothetical protein
MRAIGRAKGHYDVADYDLCIREMLDVLEQLVAPRTAKNTRHRPAQAEGKKP